MYSIGIGINNSQQASLSEIHITAVQQGCLEFLGVMCIHRQLGSGRLQQAPVIGGDWEHGHDDLWCGKPPLPSPRL